MQHQLDLYDSVDEIAEHVDDFGLEEVSAKLHWFFCDAGLKCIVVEFRQGKAVVHRDEGLTVRAVTNSGYSESLVAWERWRLSHQQPVPGGYDSMNRFIRLAALQSADDEVELVSAINDVALQGYTAFQTVFDVTAKVAKVRLPGGSWRTVSFAEGDFDCGPNRTMLELQTGKWIPYSHAVVDDLFARASHGADDLTPYRRSEILKNTSNVFCEKTSRQD